ncbi:MAG: alpha/beta hydrolase [Deltaproteobacteria bacterium]|nr:alpha/beta hydrolase [Deltaproteobacteria bacterium]
MKKISIQTLAALAVISLCMASCKPDEGHTPLPEALAALQSDNDVLCSHVPVEAWDNDSYYIFEPKAGPASTALIFYGGADCDARAYAPMAREIARAGFMMVLVKMPEDWALKAPERAAAVMEAFPAISVWAIGGHSMGGIAACEFAKEHLTEIAAVVLWASYPSNKNKLDQAEVKALSVSATNDGIYPPKTIEKSRAMLPADTVYVIIEGGNHQQFGWYTGDHEPIDGEATISRDNQMTQIVHATVLFLESL